MTFEAKKNFDLAEEMRGNLANAAQVLEKELELIASELRQDMSHGRDFEGGTFDKYSDGYAEERRRHGRKPAPPDLTITGTLRDGIKSKINSVSKESVEGQLFILNVTGPAAPWRKKSKPISNVEKAKFLQFEAPTPRKFFGISEARLQDLLRKISEAMK